MTRNETNTEKLLFCKQKKWMLPNFSWHTMHDVAAIYVGYVVRTRLDSLKGTCTKYPKNTAEYK